MKLKRTIFGLLVPLLLVACSFASDRTDYRSDNGIFREGDDPGRTQCTFDFLVDQYPYTNSATLVGAGNDCLLRGSEDHIYEIDVAVPGDYTFSTCSSTNNPDTYIYLRTGCCAGIALVGDNDGCTMQPGPSLIQAFPLQPGTYYLIVEAKDPDDVAPYVLNISYTQDPCELVFQQDGLYEHQDGTLTWVQTTDENDVAPLYTGPYHSNNPCASSDTLYGFDRYSWYDQDYGWKHVWPGYNNGENVCVQSVQVIICAWDVDEADCNAENPAHPEECELDHIFGDNVLLNPEYLLGYDQQWAISVFDIPPSAILNNGELDMFMDVDVWNDVCTWATTLNWSQLVVTYRSSACNQPPFTPEGTVTECATDDSALCMQVTGPIPADPDNDNVTFTYRWFVSNEATGYGFVDDENHPVHPVDHSGGCIPPTDSDVGDTWRAIVYAVDEHGTQSLEPWIANFRTIVATCGPIGYDFGDHNPECYPTGTNETGGPANPIHEENLAWLGDTVTADLSVTPNGDSGDDGVVFLNPPWMPCERECVDVTVRTGPGYAGEPLYIYGWKDGNLDCDWADAFCPTEGDAQTLAAPECILPGIPVTDMSANDFRTLTLCFIDPGILDLGRYEGRLRFRLVSEPVGCEGGFAGVDPLLGETEDYVITDLQLAVELSNFDAVQDGEAVDIRWITQSETNSDHFIVERRDGASWRNISGNIAGAGNSGESHQYEVTDHDVSIGTTYAYRLIAVDVNNMRQVLDESEVSMIVQNSVTVEEYALYQNYPNPFNPTTMIAFDLKNAGHVSLQIFDVLGREVAVLLNGYREMGRYQVSFEAKDLPSGLYFYRLSTPEFTSMQKMVLMK